MPPGSPAPPLSSPALQALSTGLGHSGPLPILCCGGAGKGCSGGPQAGHPWNLLGCSGGQSGAGGMSAHQAGDSGAPQEGVGVTGKRGAQKEPALGHVLLASGLRGSPGVHGQPPSAFGAAVWVQGSSRQGPPLCL